MCLYLIVVPAGGFNAVFFHLKAVARRRFERERPHRCSAVPRGHQEGPQRTSFTV